MDTNIIKDTETSCETFSNTEHIWKELFFHGRHYKSSKFGGRTELVFQSLQKKFATKDKEQEKSDIEINLGKSQLHLEDLLQYGNELVNNVKSVYERFSLLESQKNFAKKNELQEKLHNEEELSLQQFEEISKKWTEMNNLKEPMAIYEDMQRQRENIANLMASKAELIEQCQQELKQVNKNYSKDQERQSEDICFLVERVDHQIKLLKKSYRTSVNDIQNAIQKEKQKVLQTAREQWNGIFEHLSVNEANKMELVKDKQRFYAQQLDDIRRKQEDITRTTKIRLEKDAEMLELEIRKTKANILMNSEKIDYNYQVLQKRNEENIIINNQQKRRVAKLNESILVLKRKLVELKQNNKLLMEKLAVDIQKLHASINDLKTKAENFRKNNIVKLAKIWNVNFKEIKHLVTRVFDIDQILYEQQLGSKWIPPNIDWERLDYIKHALSCNKTSEISLLDPKVIKTAKKLITRQQLNDILHKISDRTGYLVEERLLEILEPYTENEKCLVKIESIFSALNISNISVVESLVKYFEPYSLCLNCSTGLQASSLKSLYSFKRRSEVMKHIKDDKIELQNTKPSPSDIVCKNHQFYMEPTLVLTALNEFLSEEINTVHKSVTNRKLFNKNVDVDLLELDKAHITSYWQHFSSFLSNEQENSWKSIEHGLNHYLEVLKRRAQIDRECVFLLQQNAELKHLLQKL